MSFSYSRKVPLPNPPISPSLQNTFSGALQSFVQSYISPLNLVDTFSGYTTSQLNHKFGEAIGNSLEQYLARSMFFTSQNLRYIFSSSYSISSPILFKEKALAPVVATTCAISNIVSLSPIYQFSPSFNDKKALKQNLLSLKKEDSFFSFPDKALIFPSLSSPFPFDSGLHQPSSISSISCLRIPLNSTFTLDSPVFNVTPLLPLFHKSYSPFSPSNSFLSDSALFIHIEDSTFNSFSVCLDDSPRAIESFYLSLPSLAPSEESHETMFSGTPAEYIYQGFVETIETTLSIILSLSTGQLEKIF